jgi:hypothetical protein
MDRGKKKYSIIEIEGTKYVCVPKEFATRHGIKKGDKMEGLFNMFNGVLLYRPIKSIEDEIAEAKKEVKDIVEVNIPKTLFQEVSKLVRSLNLWESEQDFIMEALRLKLLELSAKSSRYDPSKPFFPQVTEVLKNKNKEAEKKGA